MQASPSVRDIIDDVLRAEIELLGEVMDAVTSIRCRLSDPQLDRALGITGTPGSR